MKMIFVALMMISNAYGNMFLPQSEKLMMGFDPKRDVISDQYSAGPYLIYDCEKMHWVCVLEEHYQECKTKRAEDVRQDLPTTRCAPIGELDVKFSCFQHQLRLTTNVEPSRLCLLDRWKQKRIFFN